MNWADLIWIVPSYMALGGVLGGVFETLSNRGRQNTGDTVFMLFLWIFLLPWLLGNALGHLYLVLKGN